MHLLIENNLIDKELYSSRPIKFLFCIFFFFFNAGLLVGVAIATFILGLVMGGAVSFFLQKRRPRRKTKSRDEECEMNFTKMEDNHIKDSSN